MADSQTARLEGPVRLFGAADHPHAARRLQQAWADITWVNRDDDGSADTGDRPVVQLQVDPNMAEGAFTLDVDTTSTPAITVTGGPFSGVIYGVEELLQRRSTATGEGIDVTPGRMEAAPGLSYRTFWTWDHSTNWDLEQIGVQEIGVFNPYAKPPDGFLADYTRLVDFMSRNRIAAVVIFGFLRDSHGGVEAAQELCRYANERGVRIIPGVAINAYGGIYWEGDHPYNLATWLRHHPELAAGMELPVGFQLQDLAFPLNFPRSDYTVSGCPSRPENRAWMEEGIAWLAETFDIGGINIESGDYGVCGCDVCAARRADREDAARRGAATESWSHADMADFFPRLFEAARSQRDDLWLYSELQWDNLLDPVAHAPLRSLPAGGIYVHTLNRSYWNRVQRELTPAYVDALPTRTNVFRAQFACQWNGDRRTERYAFNGRDFADLARTAAASGMDGLTVWGEPSAYHVATELSYLAFARFTYDPTLTWQRFMAEEVAPRLGGDAAADRYLQLVDALDSGKSIASSRLTAMRNEACDVACHADEEVSRRWLWLADRLARRLFMAG